MANEVLMLHEDLEVSCRFLHDDYIRDIPLNLTRILQHTIMYTQPKVPLKERYKGVPRGSNAFLAFTKSNPDHFDLLVKYLKLLLDEFKFRFDTDHPSSSMFDELASFEMKKVNANFFRPANKVYPIQIPSPYYVFDTPKRVGSRIVNTVNTVRSHKKFYIATQSHGEFTKRGKPRWLKNAKSNRKSNSYALDDF